MLVCAVFHEDQPGGQTVRDSVYWKTTQGARVFRLCFELTPNDSNKSGINQFLEDAGVADLLSVNCERDPIAPTATLRRLGLSMDGRRDTFSCCCPTLFAACTPPHPRWSMPCRREEMVNTP
jgi:hypothetical protein